MSIVKIYNPEETCCYARSASVIINSNTGLKCWPCWGRTPSCHHQAFFTEYADTSTFARILDVLHLQNGLNKIFHHEYDCQSSQNMCDHIFQLLVDKGHLGHVRLWRTIEGKRAIGVDCIGELTHCGLVTLYGDIYLGQYFSCNGLLLDGIKPFPEPSRYWFKWRLVANLGNLD